MKVLVDEYEEIDVTLSQEDSVTIEIESIECSTDPNFTQSKPRFKSQRERKREIKYNMK